MAIHEITREHATGLALLRARIRAAHIAPPRPHNLRVATWNIRRFGEGRRWDESIEMIAAIVRQFDLVSIVELCDDTSDLQRLLAALGGHYSAIFSDYLRDAAGNRERIGFVYDSRRVRFTGLASNAEGPRKLSRGRYVEAVPWWRPPFLASFESESFRFVLLAAHLRWGAAAGARQSELDALAAWIVGRAKEKYFGDQDVLVVGDFNVSGVRDQVTEAMSTRGLAGVPGMNAQVTTDLARNKRYDEIMCLPLVVSRFTGRAGAVDFFAGNYRPLFPGRRLTKMEFTYQLSDHLPLWAELSTNSVQETR